MTLRGAKNMKKTIVRTFVTAALVVSSAQAFARHDETLFDGKPSAVQAQESADLEQGRIAAVEADEQAIRTRIEGKINFLEANINDGDAKVGTETDTARDLLKSRMSIKDLSQLEGEIDILIHHVQNN
jgi:hypothetical protein